MIREDILQQFPELFGTKQLNGREVNVEEAIATLTRELRPAIAAALTVIAIKPAVYRTGDGSSLVSSLIECAGQGKESVCLVELKARFDERRNIEWSREMEEAGVHVVYGHPSLKTHAKAVLVIRREGDGVRHYVHVGTGNYNNVTARAYEDFGLFTADEEIAAGEQALSALDYDAAFKHFDKACKADAKNPIAYFGKAESALGVPKVEADEILGERGIPVAFAWVKFTPGDWLYADRDGVLVCPHKLP